MKPFKTITKLLVLVIITSNTSKAQQLNKGSFFKNTISTHLYLIGGMNFSKQSITLNTYNSKFNYDLNDYQKNVFKPAYLLGVQYQNKINATSNYAFSVVLNKLVTGTNYTSINKLAPFINNFTKFKAEDQFIMLDINAYLKQLIPVGDTSKYKFYVVAGPSLNMRISEQSADNLIYTSYNRYYLSGNGGLEFNNQGYYTLFVHYKYALNSFTKAPITTNLNSVEMGVMIKTSNLF